MSETPVRRWLLILGAIVAIGPMSIDMYLPAFPALRAHFSATEAATQLTLASYFIGMAIGQLVYGPVSDRFGRKTPLLVGLALYVAASFACIYAPSIDALVVLRFLQALGGSAGMVMTRAMVRDRFAPQHMARVLSALVLVMGAAPILAPSAGSLVLSFAGWQAIFVVLTGFGLLCFAAAALGLAETHHGERAALAPRSVLLGYLRLLSHRRFMGYALSGGVAQGGMFAYISASSFVFIDHYGLSPTAYGWVFGTNALGLILGSQLNGRLLKRMPAQQVLRAALRTYFAAGLLMLLSVLTGFGGLFGVLLPLFVCLSSLGFTFPNSTAAAMAPFGDRAGAASALLGTLQFSIAGVTGTLVGHLHDGTPLPMAAVIAFCGLSATVLLRRLVGVPATA
jgi:DHA1 family bicyclomycin/chloramphenicol resistance-like MFS transporter